MAAPYLDAQVNLPLFVLAGAVAARLLAGAAGRRRAAALLLAGPTLFAAAALLLSLRPDLMHRLPRVLRLLNCHPLLLQAHPQEEAEGGLIIDDQDVRRHAHHDSSGATNS